MFQRIFSFFASLRLTVVCLVLAMLLVFFGTVAQVRFGLYFVQKEYFQSLLVFWHPAWTPWKIPVFPGGYLLGLLLVLNLVAAQVARFSLTKERLAGLLTHAGLVLLLLGQFATDHFQAESHMRLVEGESSNYSESALTHELALTDLSQSNANIVVAIPESSLAKGRDLQHPQLPFTLRIKQYWPNARLTQRPPNAPGERLATQGVGQDLQVTPVPAVTRTDERNLPAVLVEILTPQGSRGTWVAASVLAEPQTFGHANQTWQIELRPTRYYKPYFLTLIDFTHEKYKGTEIPKNFSSRIRVANPATGEDREALIYMNNPLRYGGETYYQGSYDPNDPRVSILQVVRNPGWLTPYFACVLVSLGMTAQFLFRLTGFVAQRDESPDGQPQ